MSWTQFKNDISAAPHPGWSGANIPHDLYKILEAMAHKVDQMDIVLGATAKEPADLTTVVVTDWDDEAEDTNVAKTIAFDTVYTATNTLHDGALTDILFEITSDSDEQIFPEGTKITAVARHLTGSPPAPFWSGVFDLGGRSYFYMREIEGLVAGDNLRTIHSRHDTTTKWSMVITFPKEGAWKVKQSVIAFIGAANQPSTDLTRWGKSVLDSDTATITVTDA